MLAYYERHAYGNPGHYPNYVVGIESHWRSTWPRDCAAHIEELPLKADPSDSWAALATEDGSVLRLRRGRPNVAAIYEDRLCDHRLEDLFSHYRETRSVD